MPFDTSDALWRDLDTLYPFWGGGGGGGGGQGEGFHASCFLLLSFTLCIFCFMLYACWKHQKAKASW